MYLLLTIIFIFFFLYFNQNRWFDEGEDDGKIVRDMTPCNHNISETMDKNLVSLHYFFSDLSYEATFKISILTNVIPLILISNYPAGL